MAAETTNLDKSTPDSKWKEVLGTEEVRQLLNGMRLSWRSLGIELLVVLLCRNTPRRSWLWARIGVAVQQTGSTGGEGRQSDFTVGHKVAGTRGLGP